MSKPSKASRVVGYALRRDPTLYHDLEGEPYADIRSDGIRRTVPIRSRAFRTLLSGVFFAEESEALGGQSATDAVDVMSAMAIFNGEQREIHVRLASDSEGKHIYLDLGSEDWCAVAIGPDGWSVVSEPPVRFRRPRGMRPLPRPTAAGGEGWKALRSMLNVDDDSAWRLIVGWLVGTLHPSGPYPILGLTGEQGTAKTTTGRILRSIIDPSKAPLRSPPRDDRDLVIAAKNSHIVAFDNLSEIKDWLSDALCRIATGGGYSARQLYTDGEEVIYSDRQPIILTSIEDVATRADLADRTIAVTLPLVDEENRKTEAEIEAELRRIRPMVLGDLLDAASAAIRNIESVQLDRLPRMADFARWVTAAEPALFWEDGLFLKDYATARDDMVETGLQADAIATAIRTMLEARVEPWKGTATDLLATLDAERNGRPAPREWPETPQAIGGRLTRAAPLLRASGFQLCRDRGTGKTRRRIVSLHRSADRCPHCPQPSEGRGKPVLKRAAQADMLADDMDIDETGSSDARPAENTHKSATSDMSDMSDDALPYRAKSRAGSAPS